MSFEDNQFLARLDRDDLASLAPFLKATLLTVPTSLFSAGRKPEFAYFMCTGLASVTCSSASGETSEVGLIGREGFAGATRLLSDVSARDCFIQAEGSAWRMPFSQLKELFDVRPKFRAAVLKYIASTLDITSQLVLCQTYHGVEQRLSRWILMARDRLGNNELKLTQEFLSMMLGTQRTTVTTVAGELQRRGLIEYRRGQIWILEPEALEKNACACYANIRASLPIETVVGARH